MAVRHAAEREYERATLQLSTSRGGFRAYHRPDEVRRTAERVFEWPRKPEGCIRCGEDAIVLRGSSPMCGECRRSLMPSDDGHETRFRSLNPDDFPLFGYAIMYNVRSVDLGGFTEIVRPEATQRTLKNASADVRALWNHDTGLVLGRTRKAGTLTLGSENFGMPTGIAPPDTSSGRDAVTLIKGGYVSGMSFRFRTWLDEWRFEGEELVRELLDIEFDEVSPVSFPAYPQTQIQAREGDNGRAWKPSMKFRERIARSVKL